MADPHLPATAVRALGTLRIGGCEVAELIREHGSPLQIVDAADVDGRAAEYVASLGAIDRPARAVFATKALPIVAVLARIGRHGIGADVTTTGELAVARAAGIPPPRMVHHGNGRSRAELAEAVASGVGLVVLDGPMDVERLDAVATGPVDVLVRITPGVAPATHASMATAHHGQKFGVTVAEAPAVLAAVERTRRLRLRGLHFHVGSQVTRLEPFVEAVRRVGDLGSFAVLDAGGGLGVPLTATMAAPTVADHVAALDDAMGAAGFDARTELIVEPGRVLVARAAVTVYSVRTVKRTAGVTFVAVDGGTSDDLEAVTGLRTAAPFALTTGAPGRTTLVGMHCDSGDVLADAIDLAPATEDDLVVMPNTGAYTFGLASNYNFVPRPAVVEVAGGDSRVLVRRETIDDLLARQRGWPSGKDPEP